jgi:hypothetical protein
MFTHYHGAIQKFFSDEVCHWIKQFRIRPRPNLLFKWLLLDIYLQTVPHLSVLSLFGEMVRMQQAVGLPFTSQQLIIEALARLDVELDEPHRNLLDADFDGDVLALLKDALPTISLTMIERDGHPHIEGNLTHFKLD